MLGITLQLLGNIWYAAKNNIINATAIKDQEEHFLLIPFFDELSFSLESGKYSVDIEGNQGYLAEGKTDIMEKAAGIYSEACRS